MHRDWTEDEEGRSSLLQGTARGNHRQNQRGSQGGKFHEEVSRRFYDVGFFVKKCYDMYLLVFLSIVVTLINDLTNEYFLRFYI